MAEKETPQPTGGAMEVVGEKKEVYPELKTAGNDDNEIDTKPPTPEDKEPTTTANGAIFSNSEAEADAARPEQEKPARDINGFKWALCVFAIFSSTFLFALDNTIVADIQPLIVTQFDAVGEIAWVGVAFAMGSFTMVLLLGQIYGQFPTKWLYIASIAWFEVGSALSGAAPNMPAEIVGRVIGGIGGSAMYIGVMTLVSEMTTIQERPMYIGGIGLTWGVGTVLGPVIGGAFANSSATWRWAFYINLVIGAVTVPCCLWLLPSVDPQPGKSSRERFAAIDYVGSVFFIGAVASFLMAVDFGGVFYDWNSAQEIALFVVSGVLFIIFGLQQAFCVGVKAENRLFPVAVLKPKYMRTVLTMFCCTAAGGASIFLPVFVMPLYFQFTQGDSSMQAAIRLLPYIFLMVFSCLASGGALSAFGFYMPWFLIGGCLTVIGGALMYTIGLDTPVSRIYGYSSIVGIGVGMFGQNGFSVVQASVPVADLSPAVAFITMAQTGGITIAIAIAEAIFVNQAENNLVHLLPGTSKSTIQSVIAGVGSDILSNLSPEGQLEALEIINDALKQSYILLMVAGSLATVLSLVMKRERLFIQATAAGA